MNSNLPLFGATHLAIIASIPAAAGVLAYALHRKPRAAARLVSIAGVLLLLNELVWYSFLIRHERFHFPFGLPLQLCDFSVWLAGVAAISRRPLAFDLAWYWGLAGAGMAVLTPDLWTPFPSYPAIYFFAAHGGVIAIVMFLLWTGLGRPRPGSWWRAFLGLNGVAALLGVFNAVFGTNYLYLCRKPVNASMLDWFGPWPWYLAVTEPFALLLFWFLWLPFRRAGKRVPAAV